MKYLKTLLVLATFASLILFNNCKKHKDEIEISFLNPVVTIQEGTEGIQIPFSYTGDISSGTVTVAVTPSGGLEVGEGKEISLSPASSNGLVTMTGNLTTNMLLVNSNPNAHSDQGKLLVLTIVSVPNGFKIGENNTVTINITDNTLANGLAAEYLFSGNTDDTSGNGNNGTNHGATLTTDRLGNASSAFAFAGSQYVSIENNEAINFSLNQEFSVSLWVSAAAVQNDLVGSVNNIIRQWVGDAQGYPFWLGYYNETDPTSARKYVGARYDGSTCNHLPEVRSSEANADFYHLVFVKSGGVLKLYVNGVLANSGDDTTVCATTNVSDLYIGCEGGSAAQCFTGKIDDIRIYNRKLSDSEIYTLREM